MGVASAPVRRRPVRQHAVWRCGRRRKATGLARRRSWPAHVCARGQVAAVRRVRGSRWGGLGPALPHQSFRLRALALRRALAQLGAWRAGIGKRPELLWLEGTFTRMFGGSSYAHVPLQCGVFSDTLANRSGVPHRFHAGGQASTTSPERTHSLTVADFVKSTSTQPPVILENAIDDWPAYAGPATAAATASQQERCRRWDYEYLQRVAGKATFNSGGHKFSLASYYQYARASLDDNPLYLFDKHFVRNTPQFGRDFAPPPYFSKERDLFEVLDGTGFRPDHRWIIVGPRRSGSRFHIDPNGTSLDARLRCQKMGHVPHIGLQVSTRARTVATSIAGVACGWRFYDLAREDRKLESAWLGASVARARRFSFQLVGGIWS